MKIFRALLWLIAALVAAAFGLYLYLFHTPAPEKPELTGILHEHVIRAGEFERAFLAYVPRDLATTPPLLFVLHGSGSSGAQVRRMAAYEFDQLADKNGFIVVYPDGFENHWNDCRASASYSANIHDVDDVAFFRRMIDFIAAKNGIDRKRVYVTGHSNGGHMAFRLGLEAPGSFAGIASFSANLPVDENMGCKKSGRPIQAAIFAGTQDPINPYEGGLVRIYGDSSRGTVLSSLDTARYWAGITDAPIQPETISHPERDGNPGTRVDELRWTGHDGIQIRLYRLEGSGHVIPSLISRFPRILGGNASDMSGPAEIIQFFSLIKASSSE